MAGPADGGARQPAIALALALLQQHGELGFKASYAWSSRYPMGARAGGFYALCEGAWRQLAKVEWIREWISNDSDSKELEMSIPIDVPGGDKRGEWPGASMQAGIDALPDGRFRGVVLMGNTDDDLSRLHVCENTHATPDQAREDAQAYVDATTRRPGA